MISQLRCTFTFTDPSRTWVLFFGFQVRVELYDTARVKFVQAHNSPLACLALSPNGKLLATSSGVRRDGDVRAWGMPVCLAGWSIC